LPVSFLDFSLERVHTAFLEGQQRHCADGSFRLSLSCLVLGSSRGTHSWMLILIWRLTQASPDLIRSRISSDIVDWDGSSHVALCQLRFSFSCCFLTHNRLEVDILKPDRLSTRSRAWILDLFVRNMADLCVSALLNLSAPITRCMRVDIQRRRLRHCETTPPILPSPTAPFPARSAAKIKRYRRAYGTFDIEEQEQELFDAQSRFVILSRRSGGQGVGYAMWRFDWEETMTDGNNSDDEDQVVSVVYWSASASPLFNGEAGVERQGAR
jgi:hypothetical protein